MSSVMSTILVIGGTSGIGESFTRRWHSAGKKVIITGRRQERLDSLKSSLPGLETYAMDNTDLARLPGHVETLFTQHPAIDTVWINSGIMHISSIKDAASSSDRNVVDEITTNLTAPVIIARHVIPRFLERKTDTTFMITGSGLGFVPMGYFPVYCPTKAAVHQFLVSIRQTLQDSNVHVLEIVAPAVRTDLGDPAVLGKFPAMGLEEYTNETFKKLDNSNIKDLKEVAAGTAVERVQAWRGSIGKILEERKLGG